MKTRVEVSTQVADFVRTLAPEPRKRLRKALRSLADEEGDIRALEAELDGFWRLRVGRYRVVFHYTMVASERLVRCDYAERRALVYEAFAEQLAETFREQR